MKRIPVTVHIPFPETLDEAIALFGVDQVYKDYLTAFHILTVQRMHAAGKIKYEK